MITGFTLRNCAFPARTTDTAGIGNIINTCTVLWGIAVGGSTGTGAVFCTAGFVRI